ncbi:hypothetical protein DK26_23285 [Bosea sp. WAO]|uniref:hypothetical protein n=1 Tax=Bosea sp. WAO TaxID=406341 RepID=UPI000749C43C|nr:hypothetical protein [Bosea sp. WAO]KUL93447.1 hypothetical protein DK26_23285 [Bosea sp. WAO]
MTPRPYQQAYDVVIRMMADALLLPPAVEPYRLAACVDRWREQRIADVCIDEFGDAARRLLQDAEGAQRVGPGAHADDRRSNGGSRSLGFPLAGGAGLNGTVLAQSASTTDRRDGGRASGNPIAQEAGHAA